MKLNKIGYGMIKYAYDTNKYRFREMVSELFGVGELERVHEIKPELVREEYRNLNIHNDNQILLQKVLTHNLRIV